MENVIKCSECSLCAIETPAGFVPAKIYHCTDRDCRRVTPDDGCTLGQKGTPSHYIKHPEADISMFASVYGR